MAIPRLALTRSGPDVIAAIDIGTNSIHMVVARVTGSGRFEVITREKEVVRLGRGAGDMKELDPDAIQRGIDALARCRKIADTWEAEVHAVATSAVREAVNRQEFIARAAADAGIEVEVISGYEEARLIHLGVLQALQVFDVDLVVVDVGGGSTELVSGRGTELRVVRSLKLGAIRLTDRFFSSGRWDREVVASCRRYVADRLQTTARALRRQPIEVLVGSSGTIETLTGMALARSGERPHSLNGATLTVEALAGVIEDLISAGSPGGVRELPGVDSRRADILLAGALIVEGVVTGLGVAQLVFSDGALREGLLLDRLQRATGQSPRHLSDLRRHGVLHLMELCEEDPDHAMAVAAIARSLFVSLAAPLELPPESAELLEAAALLANVGLFISHSRHHLHSYYVIRNAECLTGFTDNEVEMIAQIARYHRRSTPSVERHPEFAALSRERQGVVRSLAAILRVAIGLDRSHAGNVAGVEVSLGDTVEIRVRPTDGVDIDLEIWSAQQRSGLLAEVLGRPVRVGPA